MHVQSVPASLDMSVTTTLPALATAFEPLVNTHVGGSMASLAVNVSVIVSSGLASSAAALLEVMETAVSVGAVHRSR